MNSEKDHSGFVKRLKLLIGSEKPYPWAARIGITQATFNRMWKDGVAPKSDTLLLISEKTGCSIDWLLTGQGSEKLLSPSMVAEQPERFKADNSQTDRLKWFHDWIDEELRDKSLTEIMDIAVKIKSTVNKE